MNYPQNRWTRRLFIVVILLGGIFSLVSPARAQGIQLTFDDSVSAGETVENDIVLAGTSVNLDGTVDGDAVAVGASVEINGEVNGSLIAIGQNVVINGVVGGTTYIAAVTLELGPDADLGSNIYYIGASLNSEEGSSIARDLVLLSMGVQLSGEIGRNTVGIIGPWEMFKLVMETLGRPVFEPQSGLGSSGTSSRSQSEAIKFAGFLPQVGLINVSSPGGTRLEGVHQLAGEADLQNQTDTSAQSEQVLAWLSWIGEEFVTLLVFGLLGIWLFSAFIKRSAQKIEAKPLKSLGFGLLGLVLSVALVGVAILVGALILVLGIGLGVLSLWDLAWAVWGVGFTGLGLVFWLGLIFVSYGTKVIAAFMVGALIFERLAPKANRYKILPLLLGLVLYVLLVSIPYIGWVIAVLVNAFGLGAAWLVLRDKSSGETNEIEEATQEEAENEASE